MKRLKRLLTAVLVLAMVMTMLPVPFASAAEPEEIPEALQTLHPFDGTEALIRDAVKDLQSAGAVMEEKEENAVLADSVAEASQQTLDEVKTTLASRLMEALEQGEMDVADLHLSQDVMENVMEELLYDRYLYNAVTGLEYTTEDGIVTKVAFTVTEGYLSAVKSMFADYVEPEVTAEAPEAAEAPVGLMAVDGEQACVRHTADKGVQFNWVQKEDYATVADKDGNILNGGLLYDAQSKTIRQGILPRIYWALESVTYHCAACGQDVTITDRETLDSMVKTYEVYLDMTSFNPATGEGMIQVPSTDKQPEASPTLMHYTQVAVATFADDSYNPAHPEVDENGMTVGLYMDKKDNKASEVAWYYNMLSAFYADNTDYYGVAGDYWTSKNSEANPMGALKALCEMDPNQNVPPAILSMIVQMLPQAFMAYVYYYGDELLAMREKAMETVEALPASATDVQKMVILHDWLCENAIFDMGIMVQASTGTPQSDPIQLTPFGAMLSRQLTDMSGKGFYGCNCLGYTATYAYLIQNAFPEVYKNSDGSWRTPAEVDANGGDIVDYGQVMFYADTAKTSIVGEAFGAGFFNSVHYFNMVRVKGAPTSPNKKDRMTGDWFFVDTSYNDIFQECLAQYRAEADGSYHHDYLLVSPQTMDKVWHPNIDFINHLHDGYTYQIMRDENGQPVPFPKDSPRYNPAEPDHPQYEKVVAENEEFNDNIAYEQSWFSGAISKIYNDGKNWYYVDAEDDSLVFSDLMDENGNLAHDRDDADQMNIDVKKVMHARRVDKKQQDKIKVRPMSAPDYWKASGSGLEILPTLKKDPHSSVIFDYGTGKFATNKKLDLSEAVAKDFVYNEQYPGLTHTMGMWDNEIYFNLGNQIYAYSLANKTCRLAKEYHKVSAATDGRPFIASSYHVAQKGEDVVMKVVDKPLAGILINDRYTPLYNYLDSQGHVAITYDGKLGEGYTSMDQAMAAVTGREFVTMMTQPMMSVSVGTNYTYTSGFADGMSNDEKLASAYTVEAKNFNPDYAQQLEPLLHPDEIETNTNSEFLWCANIYDEFPAQQLTGMTAEAQANCCDDGHDFVYNKAENAYICRTCGLHAANIVHPGDESRITLTAKAEGGLGTLQGANKFVDPVSQAREAATKAYGQILVDVKPEKGTGVAPTGVTYTSAADGKNATSVVVTEKNNKGQFVIDKPVEAGCVEISAVYGKLYSISVPLTQNGLIIPSTTQATAGQTVTLLGVPAEDFGLQRPEVTYKKTVNGREETVHVSVKDVPVVKNSFTFVMPDADVTVKAAFVPNERAAAPETKLTVNPTTGKPVLTWNKVDGADSYEVWRAVEDGKFTCLYTTTGTRMTNSSAEPGVTYRYKVRAMSNNLAGAYSDVKEATCTCARPELKVTVRTDGKPVLTWNKVDGAVKYEVYRAEGDGDFVRLYTTTGTRMNNTSAESGKTYSYRVRALCSESAGSSTFSNTVTAKCVRPELAVPNIHLTVKASTGKPCLTWDKVSGAARYEVYRKVGKNGSYKLLYTAKGTSLTNSSAEPGTTYYYKVRAINGSSKSDFSDVKYITCDCAQPKLTVKMNSSGKPVLTWNKVDGAVKYEVYRSVNGGQFTEFYTTSGTRVTNGSARSGQTYSYQVRALCANHYGDSAFSAPVSVKVK